MASLKCTVVIPTRELFSGEIYYANIPGYEGYYGILPGHEMMVASNRSGGILTLTFDADGNEKKQFMLYEGATQVFEDKITILGRFGRAVEDIDAVDLRKKSDELSAHIEELEKIDEPEGQDKVELDNARTKLEWYQLQIDYAEGSAE